MAADSRTPVRVAAALAPTLALFPLFPLFPLFLMAPGSPLAPRAAQAQQVLYGTEGNRLRTYDIDSIGADPLVEEVLVERERFDAIRGRDVNGTICPLPDGSGGFVLGEDTDQPNPPAGFGVFDAEGRQIGKLTPTFQPDTPEPNGCAFDSQGLLFTTDVGNQAGAAATGQLVMWFPPYDVFPGPPGAYPATNAASTSFCKLATDLALGSKVAVDDQDNVYVSTTSSAEVWKFSPPFPTGPDAAGSCGSGAGLDFPMADVVNRSLFLSSQTLGASNLLTPSGLALSPAGTLYVSSVLTGRIGEYDLAGNFLRFILDHNTPVFVVPTPFGNPQDLAFDAEGSLYYADLDLVGTFPAFQPGPDGKVWRIRFDAGGQPLTPEVVRNDLDFPDGVGVLPGNLEQTEWRSYAGDARRQFFNADESVVTASNVANLVERWKLTAGAIVTGSPVVAAVDLPGESLRQVVYFQAWDRTVYAVRLVDGSLLWSFQADVQPGASFENAGSLHVAKIDNSDRVFVGAGETLYSLDAVTGEELWRFTAGTGCVDAQGQPPGLCAFDGERNQIESSPITAGGNVVFGMDVNDVATGKGGVFGVDERTGTLAWYFDPESGQTCTPLAGDEIRGFDGYHSEAELGLPAGFSGTRPGCDFPRNRNGCGNVWSSPAVDLDRELIFLASSNCDTAIDAGTGNPLPMPPFDEAIFALNFDGTSAWRWRPREFDNDDLAFGAAPNLFSIQVDVGGNPTSVDVLGIGNKDGTYTVLDRTGVNQSTGAAWDDDPATHLPADLPYWATQVVPGGDIGGILGTAAVDEASRRIHFSTAPGLGSQNAPGQAPPQQPTVHALDMDTGAVVWDNSAENGPASFAPTSAIPGVVFVGQVPGAFLRSYRSSNDDGVLVAALDLAGAALASAPVVIDGTVLVGEGIGERTASGTSAGDFTASLPSDLTALCVPGTSGCAACNDGQDNDGDGAIDAGADDGCVSASDASEVLGDLQYDNAVDELDRQRFFAAFGRSPNQVGFVDAADFDGDGVVSLVDYQTWRQALADFQNPPLAAGSAEAPVRRARRSCGLLGIEPALLLLALRRRGRRGLRILRRGARALALLALAGAPLALPAPASALSEVNVQQVSTRVDLGSTFQVDLVADLFDPVVGFGLDLVFDPAVLSLVGAPEIGPDWMAVFAPDGDGLAGLAPGAAVSGSDVLLATLTFSADAEGVSDLLLQVTDGDLTEGFALSPTGFDTTQFANGVIQVVPEPSTAWLLAAGLAALAGRRRRDA